MSAGGTRAPAPAGGAPGGPAPGGRARGRAFEASVARAVWVGAAALGLVAAAVLALGAARAATERWVAHSRTVTRLARRTLALALDRETGVRGYLLTGDSASLAPDLAARPALGAALDSLAALTADNPAQQARARALGAAVAAWEREFAAPALAARGRGARAGGPLAGKPQFDAVRAQFGAFADAEEALYAERLARDARLGRAGEAGILAAIALAAAVLAAQARAARRQAQALVEQQEALEHQAAELEEQAAELEQQTEAAQHAAVEAEAASAALAESERRFRALADSGVLALFRWTAEGGVVEANDAFLDLIGRSRAELEAGRIDWAAATPPEYQALDTAATRQLARTGVGPVVEKEYVRPDGSRAAVVVGGVATTPDGRTGIAFAVDVTARKAAERALLVANEELAATTYAIAHDLRSPLRAINGYAHFLEADYAAGGRALDDEGRALLARVRATADRMGALIDGLLALARVGRTPAAPRPVDVGALAAEVLEECRAEAPGRRIELRREEPRPGALTVEADPELLGVVVRNLVGNACKFTQPKGTPGHPPALVTVGVLDAAPADGAGPAPATRTLFVRDNGVGFDPAHAGQLFRPFHRLHRADEFPGHGIGLATVARVAARLGGRAWAEGAPGAGATFYVELPAAAPRPAADAGPPPSPTTSRPDPARV